MLVVGGGMVGLHVAYRLAKEGAGGGLAGWGLGGVGGGG